jgi:Domain of unknown function (DUF1996)
MGAAITAIALSVCALGLSATAAGYTGKVLLQCHANNSQRAQVDPLEFYGVVPSPHEHTPAGALAFSSRSTVAQMLRAPTSCYLKDDHSMAWVPTPLTPRGTPATIYSFDYYYFNAGYDITRAPPDGLRFLAGSPQCTGDGCPAIYVCRTLKGSLRAAHTIPPRHDGCDTSRDAGYDMFVYSPGQCWTGTSLGLGMGTSNPPATTTTARPCRGHAIPGLILALSVGANGLGGYLSSDVMAGTTTTSPGSTGHFDYVFGWEHPHGTNPLMRVISRCLDVTGYSTAQASCTEVQKGAGGETIYPLSRTDAPEYSMCVVGPACSVAESTGTAAQPTSRRAISRRWWYSIDSFAKAGF